MINTQVRYPILLNACEPGTTESPLVAPVYTPMPRDVYRADYTQGATVAQDHLGSCEVVLGKAGVDEEALGWTSSQAVYSQVSRGKESLVQVQQAGQPPTQVCRASGRVVASFDCGTLWQVTEEDKKACIRQWDPVSEQWTQVLSQPRWSICALNPHPSEQKLMVLVRSYSQWSSKLWELDAESGQNSVTDLPNSIWPFDFALSPDGKNLAYVDANDRQVGMLDLSSGATHPISRPEDQVDFQDYDIWHNNLNWSPDGQRLFYFLETLSVVDDTVRYGANLCVATPDGQQRRLLLREPYLEERVLSGMRVGTVQEK